MAIDVYVMVRSTPDVPGYNDTIMVYAEGTPIYACPCRSGPNPTTPWLKGHRPWREAYDWIDFGEYTYQVVSRYKYGGLCLLINGGGEVRSQNPRPNPDGTVFRGVYVHPAQSDTWPGSAGCITIQPVFWPGFRRILQSCGLIVGGLFVQNVIGDGL